MILSSKGFSPVLASARRERVVTGCVYLEVVTCERLAFTWATPKAIRTRPPWSRSRSSRSVAANAGHSPCAASTAFALGPRKPGMPQGGSERLGDESDEVSLRGCDDHLIDARPQHVGPEVDAAPTRSCAHRPGQRLQRDAGCLRPRRTRPRCR